MNSGSQRRTGVADAHLAILDEPERCRRDDRLRDRCEREDVVLLKRTAGLPVRETGSASVDDVPSLSDEDHGSDNATVFEGTIDGAIDTSA